jgi:hypothetical protein
VESALTHDSATATAETGGPIAHTHPDPHAANTRRTLKTLRGAALKQADASLMDDAAHEQWCQYIDRLDEVTAAYERIGR